MALRLDALISAVRDTHPMFSKRRVPDAVLARFFTGEQRRLISRALQVDRQFLAQQCSIVFAFSSANQPGTAGVNTSGGVPGRITSGETIEAVQSPVGSAVEVDADDEDAVVLVAESVVAAATSTTIQKTAAGWTVDAYTGKYARVTAGPGLGQSREIASNTSDTLTVGTAFDPVPDTTSMFEIVDPAIEVDEDVGVITALPAERTRTSYLVKLNASGVPYLDFSAPLVARFDVGIPIPAHHYLLPGAAVRYQSGEGEEPLSFVSYGDRYRPPCFPAAYVLNDELYLCGGEQDWTGATSIDLRYVPIAPEFTRRTDYFLLPESAYTALVAHGAVFCGQRVEGQGEAVPNMTLLANRAGEAETTFFDTIGHGRRGRVSRIKETWT